jgi:hypothetical protein
MSINKELLTKRLLDVKESNIDLSSIISIVNNISEEIRNLKKNLDRTSSTELKNYKEFNLIKKSVEKAENDIGVAVGSLFNLNYRLKN